MRQSASGINRAWLAVVGLVLLLAGVLATLIATGSWPTVAAAAGITTTRPAPADHVIGSAAGRFFAGPAIAAAVAAVGVVLGLLALAWLLAQVPRTNAAKAFRLHDDAALGLTVCQPGVLTDAVERDCENLPGVSHAAAVLRGTAAQPELTVRVSAHERTDVQQLLDSIRTDVAGHLATAMETPLKRLAVQVDVTNARRTSRSVTL